MRDPWMVGRRVVPLVCDETFGHSSQYPFHGFNFKKKIQANFGNIAMKKKISVFFPQ
jgi:hypothetical protein